MKALYIICPTLGIGEIFTIIRLSKRLQSVGVDSYFLGTDSMFNFTDIQDEKYSLFTDNLNSNNAILDEIVKKYTPDFSVFTDYNMYFNNPYLKSFFDFESFLEYKIPCYIIDTLGNLSFANTTNSLCADNYTIYVKNELAGILRPVPQHDPINHSSNSKVWNYSVFEYSDTILNSCIENIKNKLSLDKYRKVIILPLGHWVKLISTPSVFQVFKLLIRLVLYYLNKLEIPLEVCVLGECDIEYTEFNNLKVRTDLVDLSFEETNELYQVANLLITLNRFSNSLCRATLYNVPCMSLINSKIINSIEDINVDVLNYQITNYVNKIIQLALLRNGRIFNYVNFPENCTEVFDDFFNINSSYSEIIPSFEVFDENSIVSYMYNILINNNYKLKKKQKEFMDKSFALAHPIEIIKESLDGTSNSGL